MSTRILAAALAFAALAPTLLVTGCEAQAIDRTIGAACDENDDCAFRCLPPSGDYPGGFCTVSCNVNSDCSRDDTVCADTEGGVCLYVCRDDADCTFLNGQGTGAVWRCNSIDLKSGMPGLVCRGE